jgi:hypothetical protein
MRLTVVVAIIKIVVAGTEGLLFLLASLTSHNEYYAAED